MEPLDKARRHDADHALVPVFVPEDVAAPAARGLRQALDQRDGLAEDTVLYGLAVPVQLLELESQQT